MLKQQCQNYIVNNPDDVDGFINYLYSLPIQSRKEYVELISILPNENYLKEFTQFLIDNKEQILSLESSTRIKKCIDELNVLYQSLSKGKYSEKTFDIITKKYNDLIAYLNTLSGDFTKEKYRSIVNDFKEYINKNTIENVLRRNKIIAITTAISSFLITIFLIIGSIPKITYKVVENKAYVTGIKGLVFPFHFPLNKVEIESEYNGYSVEVIGEGAFINENIKCIVLPETITEIKRNAFLGCDKLSEINSVIDGEVVENTLNVHILGTNSFGGCKSLGEIKITRMLSTIKGDPFVGCYNFSILYEGTATEYEKLRLSDYDVTFAKCEITILDRRFYVIKDLKFEFDYNQIVDYVRLWYIVPVGYQLDGIVDKYNNVIFTSEGNAITPFVIKEDMELYFDVKIQSSAITLRGIEKVVHVSYGEEFVLPYEYIEGDMFLGYFTEENGGGTQITNEYGVSLGCWYGRNDTVLYPYYKKACYVVLDSNKNEEYIYYGQQFNIDLAPYIEYYENLWNCEFIGYVLYDRENQKEILITNSEGVGLEPWKWDVRFPLFGYFKHPEKNFIMSYEDLFKPYY